ncbi:MAG: DUF3109 family protein [Prevotella sp.]|nr:DUF3109 family protein [Prevotella sp.]
MIIQIDNVLVSSDILTENFCCDLTKCKGICCIEGDAGAPVTLEEIDLLEENLEEVRHDMSIQAQLIVETQGVACTDKDGDLVTSIVNGRDCVFTCYKDLNLDDEIVKNCCLCAYEKAFREGRTEWPKPISCALYPIREDTLSNGLTALAYHRWHVCKDAVKKGNELKIPIYKFLKEPLIRRFGEDWYAALCEAAKHIPEGLY